jgi:hypothetical protein
MRLAGGHRLAAREPGPDLADIVVGIGIVRVDPVANVRSQRQEFGIGDGV